MGCKELSIESYYRFGEPGEKSYMRPSDCEGKTAYIAIFCEAIVDDWNLIAELDQSNLPIRSYTWGIDLSGSEQGAGGVGGLLAVNSRNSVLSPQSSTLPSYDGNGNIISYIDTSGTNVDEVVYSPFGKILSGILGDCPFVFSSKYADSENGLVYYGKRYYDSNYGHWLSRDPIGERGGYNLYSFASNNSINATDPFGLATSSPKASLTAAIAKGNIAEVKMILEVSGDVLSVAAKQAAKAFLRRAANCLTVYAAYKKLKCKGCGSCTTKEETAANIACLTGEVAGRATYLKMKCDYVLADSIARGSKVAEAGHVLQMTVKSTALGKCIAQLATF